MADRVLHCWEDGPIASWSESHDTSEVGSTCMLLAGHDGPHEFMPNDQIGLQFAPADAPSAPEKLETPHAK